jgi:hypothetical protein
MPIKVLIVEDEYTHRPSGLRNQPSKPLRQIPVTKPTRRAGVGLGNGGESMRNAVENCDKHIERLRSEIERREALGLSTEHHRRRLKTVEALRALHHADRDPGRSNAA